MSMHLRHAAVALALVAGAEAASAQTVITREITTEPVETTIERGPAGTVITRRPLDMTVPRAAITLGDDIAVGEPVTTVRQSRETVGISTYGTGSSAETVGTRRIAVERGLVAPRAKPAARQVSMRPKAQPARKAAMRPAANIMRTTTGAAPAVRSVQAPAPALTVAQRNTIYRTIVDRREVPRTVITERSIAAPPFAAPLFSAPPVREQIITERIVAPSAPVIRETFGSAPVVERVVSAPADYDLMVGARMPATVPLYALPATVGLQFPVVRPYRYAIVDDRVFLVDPATGIIVQELNR